MLFPHPASITNKTNHETEINRVHAVFRFARLKVVMFGSKDTLLRKEISQMRRKGKAKRLRRGKTCTEGEGGWTCSDAKIRLS